MREHDSSHTASPFLAKETEQVSMLEVQGDPHGTAECLRVRESHSCNSQNRVSLAKPWGLKIPHVLEI